MVRVVLGAVLRVVPGVVIVLIGFTVICHRRIILFI